MLKYRLLSLCYISYEIPDKVLILAFVERWHWYTNTFHLSVGEMIIMLNYVYTLLHILFMGQFYT